MREFSNVCECKGPVYQLKGKASHVVFCVCGREVHRPCASFINGAWYGPECAKRMREGDEVANMVPGDTGLYQQKRGARNAS